MSSVKQRSHKRVKPAPNAPIEIQVIGDGFLDMFLARDLSEGGLSVYVAHDFAGCNIDSPIDLIIKLGAAKSFSAKGTIRHRTVLSTSHFFGVQFTRVSPDNLEKIRAYVVKRLAEGGEAR